MDIRNAVVGDAAEACSVLRRSISELCVPDHGNEPGILARWLDSKTPENVAAWIARADHCMVVAVDEAAILAVAAVTDAGKITLNYVSPDARFRGVSKAVLRHLESTAAARGASECTLESTVTARRFYHRAGYVETGPPVVMFGTPSHPMSKRLLVGHAGGVER